MTTEGTMVFNQNDTLVLNCVVDHGEGEDTSVTNIFIMRLKDELVIIDNSQLYPLKVKRGIWLKRMERFKKHRTAFKEFLAKTRSTKIEIIGIDLK